MTSKALKTESKHHRASGKEGGFSLIELMFAMSILALGMLAAASMQLSAVRNNTTGNVFTQANLLAQSQLEFLKNQDIDSADLAPGTYSDPSPVDANGQPGGIYTRSWTISSLGTQARRITVTVQWSRRGRTRRVTVSSNTFGNGL